MAPLNDLQTTLRAHGQSSTATRRSVFTALQGAEPLSMHQLIERCSTIDRASVYRTVALFERLGIVQRLQAGWKYKLELSDTFHAHHHHATCLHCGQTTALPENAVLEKLLHTMAAAHQFQLQKHQLELQGLCAKCQKV